MTSGQKIIDKLAWMPVQGRKVLFARSKGQTLFYCVGGKRELGENDLDALLREVREETGAELDPFTIKHQHTFHGPSHTGGDMKMTCYDARPIGGFDSLKPTNEVEELAWFTTADIPRTTVIGRTIIEWFKDQGLID